MTLDEIGKLLKILASYDGRIVGEADVLVWGRQVDGLDFIDAAEAVHQHYGETTERAMPSHIRVRAEKIRNARNKRPEVIAPGCYEPDPLERRRLAGATDGPLALPSRYEDDAERDARAREGRAKVQQVIHKILARRNLDGSPAWQPDRFKGAKGAWWENPDARERHANQLLAEAGRLHTHCQDASCATCQACSCSQVDS